MVCTTKKFEVVDFALILEHNGLQFERRDMHRKKCSVASISDRGVGAPLP